MKAWVFEYMHAGKLYSGHIYAESYEEAKQHVRSLKASAVATDWHTIDIIPDVTETPSDAPIH